MTENEFLLLSTDLKKIAPTIPLHWGKIQNDSTDKLIRFFSYNSLDDLTKALQDLPKQTQQYFIRRWFIWQCAKCDEYLFGLNDNVQSNPVAKDKNYDIQFNNDAQLQFDLKGTVIPKHFRNNIEALLIEPQPMIDFFYKEQSQGVRYGLQNRLFIVHHSYIMQEREVYLRCLFNYKRKFFAEYANKMSSSNLFLMHQQAKAGIILILEQKDKTISVKYF